jgi:glycosyltransferase involved in cell wall biosynthesis
LVVIKGLQQSRPIFSVVITAYNRKQYLKCAVDSVLNQSLARELYEVLIAKNFVSEYDNDWKFLGIRLVAANDVYRGRVIANLVPNLRGDFVAFLDDDDWWHSSKLERALTAIQREPRLCYYHNGLMDVVNGKTIKVNRFWLRAIPWGNSSSTVIKKQVLLDQLDTLRSIRGDVDLFYYYASLITCEPIFLDKFPSTYYRQPTTVRPERAFIPQDQRKIRKMISDSGNHELLRNFDLLVLCGQDAYSSFVEKAKLGKRVGISTVARFALYYLTFRPGFSVFLQLLLMGIGLFAPHVVKLIYVWISPERRLLIA